MNNFGRITRPLFWFIAILLTAFVAGCGSSGGGGGGSPADTAAPTVSSNVPANEATGIALNANITATFSEVMDPLTLTAETFTLQQGTTAVPGVVSYVGSTATFNPTANLAAGANYTATVTSGVKDLAGNAMAVAKTWTFTTGATADTTAPIVSSTVPADGATGIAVNANITATFSEAIDAATISTATFTLRQAAAIVAGSVSYVGNTATFDPTASLLANTLYTATLTTGVKDLSGNALVATTTWSFTTGAAADTSAPTVSSTLPADAATGLAINANITATFSEAMDATTISSASVTLKQGANVIAGSVTYVGTTATFNPTGNLLANTLYTATVTTTVKDLAGNALAAPKTWSFTTAADPTPPTVSFTAPANAAIGVALNANITATFSEAMDPLSITTDTFTLQQGITAVPGVVSYVGTTATFNPTGNLLAGTPYTVTLSTGIKDLAGNTLVLAKLWSFTTVASGALGPQPVDLGLAGNFVLLAKSGISTVPTSAVSGDIGVSPIDQTAITGFSETMDPSNTFSTATQVTGKIYAADYTEPTPTNLTTAVLDMQTAYTDAAGRPLPDFTELGAGEIGGLTLVPGLYKWGTGVNISTDVTLNGGPNDVWIFQIAGDITMAAATNVTLIGGALPKNIFWQSFGAVALNTTAHFEGIILSQTAISLATGATVNGRLLSQTAITLDGNAVTQPAP
jgi:methionine-rich copper-binding protein CopC